MHYQNGREAKVGDLVVGKTYNLGGKVIAGTLVSLTSGPDSCSAIVGFLELKLGTSPLEWGTTMPVKVQGTQNHGAKEPLAATVYREDYTECKLLLHVEDAYSLSTEPRDREQTESPYPTLERPRTES